MTVDRVDWSTDDVLRHLRSSPVFRQLDDESLAAVADCATIMLVPAGDAVMEEGTTGDEAFVVIAGRLDVLTRSSDGSMRSVNHLGPGDVVGEMALITEEPRSATVRARRDSALMRIGASDFRSIVLEHPEALLDVTRTVMHRLNHSIHDQGPQASASVVAVLPAGGRPAHYEFARAFAEELGTQRVEVVTAATVRRDLGADATVAGTAQYLHRVEDRNDYVILVGEADNTEWTEMCHRQSDVSLLVGYADAMTEYGEYEDDTDTSDSQLVLVHDTERPDGTADVLAERPCVRYHHIRHGSRDDIARVARIVRGASVGVVFGGGGARGFAHLGVWKALIEAGIPIDHVGGASIGASIAAGCAMGFTWERLVELERWVTFERGSLVDSTFPAVAVARGKRLTDGMRDGYGDADIRDLWTDFFCVSTDLTEGRVHVHRSGPVWEAVRSSVSIPGVFPPMRSSDGHVLVDGGVLDNVPTATMTEVFAPHRMIAIDLRARSDLASSDLPDTGSLSGWRVARSRFLPWKRRLEVPGLIELLIAASTISGSAKDVDADLVIRPPVGEFGFMDYAACDDIIEVGYRHAVDVLEHHPVVIT